MASFGTNVAAEVKGDKLIITVDVSKKTIANAEPSKSGKSNVVGSTNGFVKIGGVSFGLNVIVKPSNGDSE